MNTASQGYVYRVELYNNAPGNRFLIPDPGVASSLFVTASPGDRKVRFTFSRNVPWINSKYDIYRYNNVSDLWDLVGSTDKLTCVDNGLVNGSEYCYYVVSTGGYQGPGTPKNLINFSQHTCATPVDNEAPCKPELNVSSECDSLYNKVTWDITDPFCYEDVAGYNLYYNLSFDGELTLLQTFNDRTIKKYIHSLPDYVAGCYAVSAFDSNGNEGEMSTRICVDSCNFYEIPNVFTPNDDDINDWLVAKTSGLVEKVEFKLFNRAGVLIFSTQEPKLNWNGTYKGKLVPSGVYFYDCEVFERRMSTVEQIHLNGFVHVITEKGAGPNIIEDK